MRDSTELRVVRVRREEAATATGVAVVIDVVRAFSVAAYALAGGAEELWLVSSTDDALALRQIRPDALLAGEIHGRLIPGFDLNNSPSLMAQADIRGRLIIQLTGAGTRTAVACARADHLLACSLVNARATADLARLLAQEHHLPITLIPTEPQRRGSELEDEVCADYLEALLAGSNEARQIVDDGIRRLLESDRFAQFTEDETDFPAGDVPVVLDVDRFDFAMVGARRAAAGTQFVKLMRLTPTPL